tara:strand:+ start:190 stop:441 length:252 start_codon:yes stop_codon:yes gene_type:complete
MKWRFEKIQIWGEEYNGWTNRETWLVNLHFNPETIEDLDSVKGQVEELEEDIQNSFLRDYVDFSKIDWHDLEEGLVKKEIERG